MSAASKALNAEEVRATTAADPRLENASGCVTRRCCNDRLNPPWARFGFELISSNTAEPPFVWVLRRRDTVELMLDTMNEADDRPPAQDPIRNARHSDVTLYIGCSGRDGLYAELQAQGISVQPPATAPHGMRQLGRADPDG